MTVATAKQAESPPSTPISQGAQDAIRVLRRDFAAECLRIAGLKLIHAADNIELDDKICARHDLAIARSHAREGVKAFSELQAMAGEP